MTTTATLLIYTIRDNNETVQLDIGKLIFHLKRVISAYKI